MSGRSHNSKIIGEERDKGGRGGREREREREGEMGKLKSDRQK